MKAEAYTIADPFGKKVNILLLLFLVLVLDVKLAIKIPALVLVYAFQWNFSFGFRLRNSRLPLFYPLVVVLTAMDWLIVKGLSDAHYNLVAISAIVSWLACLGACHQVKLFTERQDMEVIHQTLWWFFLFNLLFSLGDLLKIIWEVKALNPYLYQGDYQKYFIRTGDYIRGLTFDTSTTNALINAFAVFYFLYRKQAWMMLACMACLLATGSNFTNICMLGVLALVFIFRADRQQKGGIILCVCMGVVFLGKVSPQNNRYTEETFNKWRSRASRGASRVSGASLKGGVANPGGAFATGVVNTGGAIATGVANPGGSLVSATGTLHSQEYLDSVYARNWIDSAQRAELAKVAEHASTLSMKPVSVSSSTSVSTPTSVSSSTSVSTTIPVPDINSAPYQNRADTSDGQRILLSYIAAHGDDLPLASQPELPKGGHMPGKLLALAQTGAYFRAHPWKLWTGMGAGNYSSKLAFRATGLSIAGGYPSHWTYINTDFQRGQLDLYLAYFSRPKDQHSLTNSPDSVYGQLWGEYGITGLLLLIVTYLGFFARRLDWKGYTAPIFLLMVLAFGVDYWFEQLSVLVLFELLMFTDLKKTSRL
jgi:hypothetical protein